MPNRMAKRPRNSTAHQFRAKWSLMARLAMGSLSANIPQAKPPGASSAGFAPAWAGSRAMLAPSWGLRLSSMLIALPPPVLRRPPWRTPPLLFLAHEEAQRGGQAGSHGQDRGHDVEAGGKGAGCILEDADGARPEEAAERADRIDEGETACRADAGEEA